MEVVTGENTGCGPDTCISCGCLMILVVLLCLGATSYGLRAFARTHTI